MNTDDYIKDKQKLLDESFENDLKVWLQNGFSLHDAELACLISRLPLGGIPTKYKELRKRCLEISAIEVESVSF